MLEQWRRVFFTRRRHWRRVGSRAAADEGNKTVDRKPLLLLCLPTTSIKVTATCNKEKNTQLVDFRLLFLCFSDLFFFLFFSILDLLLSTDRFFSFSFPFFSVSGGGKTKGAVGC
jgi:hypothetical protein